MHCIDFHTHAFSNAVAEKAMTYLVEESGYTPAHDGTLLGLKGELKRVGIDKAVVLSIATKPKQVPVINDWILDCHAQSGRDGNGDGSLAGLVFFGALHPQFEAYENEIERLRMAGVRGVKLHPNYQEFYPDDPVLRPMFQALADAGLIVLIHAGHDIAFPDAPGSPDRLARLNDAVPNLPLVCAHFGGWRMWTDVERHLVRRPNVYLDTSFTLGDLPDERFVELVRRHGIENVLFATDSPWRDQKLDLDHIDRLPFTPGEREAILWKNALRLLE
jgi:predicted TIM-barrel fold metal-dependent hydrolase